MNITRQQLESLFNKERPISSEMLKLCNRNPEFMSSDLLPPEFILQEHLEFEDIIEEASIVSNDIGTSIAETLTFCSNFSRIDTLRVLYKEVFQKRARHTPFCKIIENSDEKQDWYYIEDRGEQIFGPFSTEDMDQRFKWGVLREKTRVKTKFDDEYKAVGSYIKRYVTKLISDREEREKTPKKISNKIAKFRKGEELSQQNSPAEVFERRNREERVFSHMVRPNLIEIPKFVIDGDAAEQENVGRTNRNRATTLQPYTHCS